MEFHEALRRAYAGRATQAEIAEALGTTQTTISRWARGEARPSFEDLAALEVAAGRPKGYVLKMAGFVADEKTVPEAVALDPALDEVQRELVLSLYRSFTQPS